VLPRAPRARLTEADRLLPRGRSPRSGAGALKNEDEIRAALRAWIVEHARTAIPSDLGDTTPILDSGLLSSLDVVELVLFIENLRGDEVDVDAIEPESLRNIDSLFEAFFQTDAT
jgi:acyl carrier protein